MRVSGIRSSTWADCNGSILLRGAPFGVPVVPLVSNTNPPGCDGAGSGDVDWPAINSSCWSPMMRTVSAGSTVEQVEEFVVGENAAHLFSRGDIGKLRAGEAAVHQHQPNAEFVRRPHRRHQVPAVAVQRCDNSASANSLVRQRTGQRTGKLVELAEAERAAFVGDRRRIAVAGGGVVEQSAERAVATHGQQRPHRLVGPHAGRSCRVAAALWPLPVGRGRGPGRRGSRGVGPGDRCTQEVPGDLQAGEPSVARPQPIAVHQARPQLLVAATTQFHHLLGESLRVGAHDFP